MKRLPKFLMRNRSVKRWVYLGLCVSLPEPTTRCDCMRLASHDIYSHRYTRVPSLASYTESCTDGYASPFAVVLDLSTDSVVCKMSAYRGCRLLRYDSESTLKPPHGLSFAEAHRSEGPLLTIPVPSGLTDSVSDGTTVSLGTLTLFSRLITSRCRTCLCLCLLLLLRGWTQQGHVSFLSFLSRFLLEARPNRLGTRLITLL
ncbi:hypothetical protein C8Q80DRAFT_880322 [Daedaleopsis nitida]|nr:hypothetical protein C8Q80DRAFT_880322 [Daedaleopsis nitida]